MNDSNPDIRSRKLEHLWKAWAWWHEHGSQTNGFDDLQYLHNPLPSLDSEAIDTRVKFLGHSLEAPLMITAMTGGHPAVAWVNRVLGKVAASLCIPIEVGSQRAGLEYPELVSSFTAVRENNPDLFVVGNVGIVQLARAEDGPALLRRAVDMIGANAMTIHLNPLQEQLQPGGDPWPENGREILREVINKAPVPVIVKEVGCGISGPAAQFLASAGVGAINVAGAGGTNFCAIELARQQDRDNSGEGSVSSLHLGSEFKNWGTPTPVAIKWVRTATDLPVIGSGGVRTGLDLAKCLSLGADLGGIAGALLPALFPEGFTPEPPSDISLIESRVAGVIHAIISGLKIVMANQDAPTVRVMKQTHLFPFGRIKEWFENLHL